MDLNKPKVDQVFSDASVLTCCLDANSNAFDFNYNGLPLGDQPLAGDDQQLKIILQSFSMLGDMAFIQANSGEAPRDIIKSLCIEGNVYTFLLNISRLPADGKATCFVSLRDITSISATLGEKKSNDMLLGLVTGNMTDVFCVLNLQGKLIFLSPSVEKLTGFTPGEIIEKPFHQMISEETFGVLQERLTSFDSLRKKKILDETDLNAKIFQIEYFTKAGEKRWAEVSAAPYCDHNHKLKGAYGIIRDITEQKQKQEEIQSTLLYEIELSNVKSKYISSVSHEFRTPLSIIYSNLQLLEAHLYELDAETLADAFDLSKMAVKSLLRVLDKVTIIDAAGKGKLEFKPSLVNLESLVHNIVNEVNEMEVVPGRIISKIAPEIGDVILDEHLFNQILSNLLLNALKYSDKKQFVNFDVSLISENELYLEVRDKGIGIPPQDKNLIFEPFYRASNSRAVKGSGLGLAVVKECLKLHQGSIVIESKPGEGTTVKVKLSVVNTNA